MLFLKAVQANLRSAVILWIVGALVVWSYYHVAPVQEWFTGVIHLRERVGLLFPVLSTSIAGAVIPAAFELFLRPDQRQRTLKQLGWLCLFWAYKGIEVDLFFVFQAKVFGADTQLDTVLVKLLVDAFVYNPLIAVPITAFFYRWLNKGHPLFHKGWYGRHVLPMLLFAWAVWIPAVLLIYLMPTPLQVVLQNLVLAFYALLLIFLCQGEAEAQRAK